MLEIIHRTAHIREWVHFCCYFECFWRGGASAADVVEVVQRRSSLRLRDGNLQDELSISAKVERMSCVDGERDVAEGAGWKTNCWEGSLQPIKPGFTAAQVALRGEEVLLHAGWVLMKVWKSQ